MNRRFLNKEGKWVWVRATVSLVRDEDGSPLHFIAQFESLEARRRAEAELAAERERLKITLSSIADAVITTDAETRITYINAAGENLLGQGLRDLEHRRLADVISLTEAHTSKAAVNLVAQCLLHGTAVRREFACVLHRPDGVACFVRDVISPVVDARAMVTGLVVVLQDASADVERASELSHQASHDVLTGLANRLEFQRRLAKTFRRAQSGELAAAILAIDLDRFKVVNDVGGHAAGDAMLGQVAEVLRRHVRVRGSDTIARLGGDEFAIILDRCPQARATLVAGEILRALNPVRIEWNGATYEIGASIGLAMSTPALQSEAAWMAAADQACYQAKRSGRAQLRIADTEGLADNPASGRAELG
jgi:diguanylate cyclase